MSKKTVIMVAVSSFTITMLLGVYTKIRQQVDTVSSYDFELEAAPEYGEPLAFINEEYIASKQFTSHMPIVVLDTQDIEVPITLGFNEETKRFEAIEGLEPYISGSLSLFDNGGQNQLSDVPIQETDVMIKRRGNSSMLYDKPQYLVKLKTPMGQENELDLLAMGANDEWILNGSLSDKSMMRNYLCYRTASQILAYTPDSRYCEVLIKSQGEYIYQGVYLLCENVRQGEERIAISPFAANSAINSFVVRRDRYDEAGTMLHTYLQETGKTDTWIGMIYPGKTKVTKEVKQYAQDEMNKIEKVLYSDYFKEYSQYKRLIDVDSFVDYFIINEFFMNYDAGQHSTYLYKEIGEPVKIGPVWDFDGAIDNYQLEPANAEVISFYTAPWFERLMLDENFLQRVEKRYTSLRETILSEESVDTLIEEIRAYLGPAQKREWERWKMQYTQKGYTTLENYRDDEGLLIYRETKRYEQELYRIKTILNKHGKAILPQLKNFHETAIWNTEQSIWQIVVFMVCISTFFFSILYVNRRDK